MLMQIFDFVNEEFVAENAEAKENEWTGRLALKMGIIDNRLIQHVDMNKY